MLNIALPYNNIEDDFEIHFNIREHCNNYNDVKFLIFVLIIKLLIEIKEKLV